VPYLGIVPVWRRRRDLWHRASDNHADPGQHLDGLYTYLPVLYLPITNHPI